MLPPVKNSLGNWSYAFFGAEPPEGALVFEPDPPEGVLVFVPELFGGWLGFVPDCANNCASDVSCW